MGKAAQGFLSEAYFEYVEDKKPAENAGQRKKDHLFTGTGGREDDNHPCFFEKQQVL
jgi:hypothetical protein